MRSLFKGVMGFGLVSIPIEVYKAMESERVETHWIHTACHARIRYQKYCPGCERTVTADEVVTGAPLADGRYVVLPPPKFQAAEPHIVTILNFPRLSDIDPVFWDAAYWLKPGPGGAKAYGLLTRTMNILGRVALAELVLRSRPSLAVVRPFNDHTLMLHRMYYPESLRQEGARFGEDPPAVSDQERQLAKTLVQQLAEPFDPARYPNRQRLERLKDIERLAPSAVVPHATPQREVWDLMERLKASVQSQSGHSEETGSE